MSAKLSLDNYRLRTMFAGRNYDKFNSPMFEHICVVYNVENNRYNVFNYFMGESYQKYVDGVWVPVAPSLPLLLETLASEALSAGESFEEFCDSLGYSSDSISARKMYDELVEVREKLQHLGLAPEKVLEILES